MRPSRFEGALVGAGAAGYLAVLLHAHVWPRARAAPLGEARGKLLLAAWLGNIALAVLAIGLGIWILERIGAWRSGG